MSMILEGIKIVDLGLLHAAPSAAAMLGDLGAEVIKVEEPNVGDPLRGLAKMLGMSVQMPSGRHVPFEDANHSKKGITLNLRKPQGKEILYKLVEKSDVFVTNYREQALKSMAMDYETLRRYNPCLIYGFASTLGTHGPDRDLPGIDMIGQARSGIMMQSGEEDMPPVLLPTGTCDRVTSIFLAYGIIAALFARERLGVGQRVHVSMLGAMINLQSWILAPMLMLGKEFPRWNRRKNRYPLYNYFQCKDGCWLALPLYQGDRYFPVLCKQLCLPELLQDPRFADDDKRAENAEALNLILEKVFATKTCREWQKILGQADLLFAPIQRCSDLLTDPQVIANDYIVNWDHPAEGHIRYVGFPVEFSETPLKYISAAPELGQHTEEVLQQILGYNWEQIGQLREAGVI